MGKIKDIPTLKPFIVGLYVGKGIPENFDLLLEDLAKDIEIGQNEGFKVDDHIVIRYEHLYTICDAPARSKVLFFIFIILTK